ncbi:MAG TPA: glycosyltransferase [Pirellulaceae bacterium]|jgi:glycosyltransferase involved in cell wall biosynthesis|nr:glycosyltransferase [Pirellulaceae bacterium]
MSVLEAPPSLDRGLESLTIRDRSSTRDSRDLPRAGRPLRVAFLATSLPVGGAETLLAAMMRGFDPATVQPEVVCLKERGPLGEVLAKEFPVHAGFLNSKYDLGVLSRLKRLFQERRIDAVVTVGAGDKMFWGRIAARMAGVPVVLSALHSTGWPDGVGKLNRLLTPWTDGFIGVAKAHGRHLIDGEGFPQSKVFVIPNGVDVDRFRPRPEARTRMRKELGFDDGALVVGVVAALRPEKHLTMFLEAAGRVSQRVDRARFAIVGDGPERAELERKATELGIADRVRFLGSRSDIHEILPAFDLFSLTSKNEANPISILEAFACGTPVAAPDVGSIHESVVEGETGMLFPALDVDAATEAWLSILENDGLRQAMGAEARRRATARWSIQATVDGYERLIVETWLRKR